MILALLSDIHYAGPQEKQRTSYEFLDSAPLVPRLLVLLHRHYFWLRDPLAHNHLLHAFIHRAQAADLVAALGDYSCDSAYLGLSDPAALESAQLCLGHLRTAFPNRFLATFGDHELGKVSIVGQRGGLRIESWHRARKDLALVPFWTHRVGPWTLIGVVSSLVALPVFDPEILPNERSEWQTLRATHLAEIRAGFQQLDPRERVILLCHDPTALPFLMAEDAVRTRLPQIVLTVIGHLHTPLIYWQSRCLAGMPRISFLGNTARRLSEALRRARQWKPFHVRLCPSLTGCQLLKDGGYATLDLDESGRQPPRFVVHRLPWDQNHPPPARRRTAPSVGE